MKTSCWRDGPWTTILYGLITISDVVASAEEYAMCSSDVENPVLLVVLKTLIQVSRSSFNHEIYTTDISLQAFYTAEENTSKE